MQRTATISTCDLVSTSDVPSILCWAFDRPARSFEHRRNKRPYSGNRDRASQTLQVGN
ncbi:hypothetical protein BX666DRAFT_1936475 [Dichotomocladium elegans]|nr:hypothetical protein BX666DRAFT_1936475 [Dichotomocladium elegans]